MQRKVSVAGYKPSSKVHESSSLLDSVKAEACEAWEVIVRARICIAGISSLRNFCSSVDLCCPMIDATCGVCHTLTNPPLSPASVLHRIIVACYSSIGLFVPTVCHDLLVPCLHIMSTPSAGSGLVPATINLPISNRPAPPSLPPLGPVPLYIAQRVGDFLYAPLTFTCPGICPHSSCFLAVVRSFRQGVVYGAKIRFPHALVMTLLFRSGTLTEKANDIISATYTHARTLGLYAATYKLATCILRHVTRQPNSPFIPLIGGMVGGGLLFGRNTPINVSNTQTNISRTVSQYQPSITLLTHSPCCCCAAVLCSSTDSNQHVRHVTHRIRPPPSRHQPRPPTRVGAWLGLHAVCSSGVGCGDAAF